MKAKMNYKWNDDNNQNFWDNLNNIEYKLELSDKLLINNPDLASENSVLRALCRIVSELIEIEETRTNRKLK
jgi:hypothetical protein